MSNNSLTSFNYNGQTIQKREDGYLNLTQMCQANGKLAADFLRLKGTKSYIEELAASMGIPIDDVVESKEGAMYGTWGHPLLALRCAQWISAKFAVWCDSHIFNLMESGSTSLDVDPIEEMKLKIELARLEKDKENAIAQQKQADVSLTQFRHTITQTCPEPVQQKVLGYSTVEKVEYRDRVLSEEQLIRDGHTINKTELCRRYGFVTKSGNPDYKKLNKVLDSLDLPESAYEDTYAIRENKELKREYLENLDQMFMEADQRNLYLGE